MGLASFNRMRLKRVEEMRPENIELTNKAELEKINEEKPIEEIKEEPARRGSSRKK